MNWVVSAVAGSSSSLRPWPLGGSVLPTEVGDGSLCIRSPAPGGHAGGSADADAEAIEFSHRELAGVVFSLCGGANHGQRALVGNLSRVLAAERSLRNGVGSGRGRVTASTRSSLRSQRADTLESSRSFHRTGSTMAEPSALA